LLAILPICGQGTCPLLLYCSMQTVVVTSRVTVTQGGLVGRVGGGLISPGGPKSSGPLPCALIVVVVAGSWVLAAAKPLACSSVVLVGGTVVGGTVVVARRVLGAAAATWLSFGCRRGSGLPKLVQARVSATPRPNITAVPPNSIPSRTALGGTPGYSSRSSSLS